MANTKTTTVTNIYENIQKAKAYQDSIRLRERIKKFNDFVNGKQWSDSTERTKNFPRPVFNVTKMIIENKASAISGNPIQIKFTTQLEDLRSRQFNDFNQHMMKQMDFPNVTFNCTMRALNDGTGLVHYFWDESMHGDNGDFKGGLNAEVINITNCYFSDPQEDDIQRQRWIILETRLPVDYVKSICENEEDKELIVSDYKDSVEDSDYRELDDDSLVTVYTEYSRDENGEVKFTKATKSVVIHTAKFINPLRDNDEKDKVKMAVREDEIELDEESLTQTTTIDVVPSAKDNDSKLTKEKSKTKKFSLYPLALMVLSPLKDSIYGKSEVEDLVNVQRAINTSVAFSLLTLQNSGSPKIVAKKGALKGQEITNEVGEVIIDHTPVGTQGFYTLQQQPSVAGALQLAPQLFDFVRTITNTNDIMSGDKINSNVSGTAIAQAQAQAKSRIKLQENQLFKFVKESVRIIEKFQRLFYVDEPYTYKASLDAKLTALSSKTPIPNYYKGTFTSNEFDDLEISTDIEVGYGTQYSESLEIDMLNNLLGQQFIDFDTYVELVPQSIMPFKSELKEKIAMKQQSELEQLKVENAQLKQQNEQQAIYSKQQEKAIKDLSSQLDREMQLREKAEKDLDTKVGQLREQNTKMSDDIARYLGLGGNTPKE